MLCVCGVLVLFSCKDWVFACGLVRLLVQLFYLYFVFFIVTAFLPAWWVRLASITTTTTYWQLPTCCWGGVKCQLWLWKTQIYEAKRCVLYEACAHSTVLVIARTVQYSYTSPITCWQPTALFPQWCCHQISHLPQHRRCLHLNNLRSRVQVTYSTRRTSSKSCRVLCTVSIIRPSYIHTISYPSFSLYM